MNPLFQPNYFIYCFAPPKYGSISISFNKLHVWNSSFPSLLVQAPSLWAFLDFFISQGLCFLLNSLSTYCMHIVCIMCSSHLALSLDHLGIFLTYFFIISASFENYTLVFWIEANAIFLWAQGLTNKKCINFSVFNIDCLLFQSA